MEKTSDIPTQIIVFLGILLDSVRMLAKLPEDELQNYSGQVEETLDKSKLSPWELQSVIGHLQFATTVVKVGKAFLRHLYYFTIGVSKP